MVELSDMPREEIIQIKYGLTAGTKPSSLLRGELAVNLADLLAFVGNDLGAAVPLLGKDYLLASASYDTDTSGITVPQLAEFVEIVGCGGGGGGGGGSRSNAGSGVGGAGGGGAQGGSVFFPLDELGITAGSVLRVVIGTGGVGGAGTFTSGTQPTTAGNNGSSTFLQSNNGSITYMEFPGGRGAPVVANNGTVTTTDYGFVPRFRKLIQGDGGISNIPTSTSPSPVGNGTPSVWGGGGGGAGAQVNASGTNFYNGTTGGGLNPWVIVINGGGGGTPGTGYGNNANITDAPANGTTGWGGGGGGSRNAPGVAGRNGGNGADGGPRGGGGGGGGALRSSRTDCRPGNGGTGGNGYITLRWWGLVGQTVYGKVPLR